MATVADYGNGNGYNPVRDPNIDPRDRLSYGWQIVQDFHGAWARLKGTQLSNVVNALNNLRS